MLVRNRAGIAVVGEVVLVAAAFITPGLGIAMTWLLLFGQHGGTAAIVNLVGQVGSVGLALSGSVRGRYFKGRLIASVVVAVLVYAVAVDLAGPSAL